LDKQGHQKSFPGSHINKECGKSFNPGVDYFEGHLSFVGNAGDN